MCIIICTIIIFFISNVNPAVVLMWNMLRIERIEARKRNDLTWKTYYAKLYSFLVFVHFKGDCKLPHWERKGIMTPIDWTIVIVFAVFIATLALIANRYNKSVADFLAANRCGGRYMLAVAEGVSGLGAISIIGAFEAHYDAGFSFVWWSMLVAAVNLVIPLTGWVIYRFRETRALTLAQFLQKRYSRNFRIFAGIVGFVSGIVNFGIFPAIGSRFFLYFCGFPKTFILFGITISTFAVIMAVLLLVSLLFTFLGGQIAVIITDFVQGAFVNILILVLVVFCLVNFPWSSIMESILKDPDKLSLVHPFHSQKASEFNVWYFLIASFGMVYTYMAWQGSQGYNASAITPHEAKMGKILGQWRLIPQTMMFIVLPMTAYTFLHHPDYADSAVSVQTTIDSFENETIRNQMTVPIVLSYILTTGLKGAFVAIMLAAFVSTHDTYLHSWGCIFIQDVIMPFRKKPFTRTEHMRLLRISIVGVAVFIFVFSLLWIQTDFIFMFFAVTGAMFLGGAGSVIIGGLYWSRGTTAAAWASMICGSSLATLAIALEKLWPLWFDGAKFPINGQTAFFISSFSAIAVYIAVSLFNKAHFNMDRLLHRGEYTVPGDRSELSPVEKQHPVKAMLGIGKEYTRQDKLICRLSIGWTLLWIVVFAIGLVWNSLTETSVNSWSVFWRIWVYVFFAVSTVVTVWLTLGGILDTRAMLLRLKTVLRDDRDNGWEDGRETADQHSPN